MMRVFSYSVALASLLKAVVLLSIPSLLVFLAYVLLGAIGFQFFIYGYLAVLGLLGVVLYPVLSNLEALTRYVRALAQDRRVDPPRLSLLGSVGELSTAVSALQRSWEQKKTQMETVISDREILVDTLPDILIMANDDLTIVRTNSAARAIFGQNLAGQNLRTIIDNDALIKTVAAVIQDFRGREVEFHFEAPNNAYEFHAIVKRFTGPSTGFTGSVTTIITLNDITELRRAEQMRADFVANASHEIRTPLASIKGFIETIQGPAKDDPAARDEFLRIMAEQADRMTRLISDLLSLSKIEMNAHTIPMGKVDVLRVIRSEKQNFERAASEKNMTIRMELHDNLPLARGEESEVTQVVHNLIGNAVKYGNPDTQVTVTARATSTYPAELKLHHGNVSRMIAVSVRDKGEGIPKQHLPRLTERFYRVDSARTRKIGGTGLGLAIVKHILNRHQAMLTIDSVVGEGSTFTVYLPVYGEQN